MANNKDNKDYNKDNSINDESQDTATKRTKDTKNDDLRCVLEAITKLNYINPDDIPDIPLYMDQVTTFMDERLSSYKRFDEDKILTKTMINNYSKNNLLPPPEKKKYSKNHMLLLTFIYYFKNFLSISDIQDIFSPMSERFFDRQSSEIDLEDIYKYVFEMEFDGMEILMKDVVKKYNLSKKAFPKLENEDDNEVLSRFGFICMLSFDVYVKKMIIEKLIDTKIKPENMKQNGSKSKKDQKNQK